MKFLIAPNALKGSLSAVNAASIIQTALREAGPDTQCILSPIADGGDGTLDCLVSATGGKIFRANVHGPISSMKVNARWGILGDSTTAVIEMAEAAGLRLLNTGKYDVAYATTYGVGELILKAMNAGCRKIIVGMGGSATNDGGAGCARALGVKFFDGQGRELLDGGIHLSRLHHIEHTVDLRIKNCEVIALSDVTNILCGPHGAAFTFGEQKGATAEQIRMLDEGLRHYASIIERGLHVEVSTISGSGAAGGLGAGLIAFTKANIISGIDFILSTLRFDKLLEECDCVITTEGMLDSQTLHGKGVGGVARRALKFNKPVHAFVGKVRGDARLLQRELRLSTLHQISPEAIPIGVAMKEAEAFLSKAITNYFHK